MEEELEWERELEENIKRLFSNGAGGTEIVVDGTAVRRRSGLVMISGDWALYEGSTSTEIYDYRNNSVQIGPDMKVARFDHASVTLPTGDIALFGGYNYNMNPKLLFSCEVFNVESNSFSEIGNMIEKRSRPAAVLLPSGVVFIIGGHNGCWWLNTCEFYNPADKTFSRSKAKLMVGRYYHTASLLPNGKVLVCGGYDGTNVLQTTEIYDPSTDSFSAGPLMTVKRNLHSATTLVDGKVLITGGEAGISSNSTELYDPSTNSFTDGPKMGLARVGHFSSLLPDGRVLIGGGYDNICKRATEIYDPVTDSFYFSSPCLLESRKYASAILF